MRNVARHGTWISPITASLVAAAGLRLSAVSADGDDVYWLEGRPAEGGRVVLVRRDIDGLAMDVTPREINVRSRVHEYGGGAYTVAGGVAFVCNLDDGRVYRVRTHGVPEALTPPGAMAYGDLTYDPARASLIAVREDRTAPGEPVNALVRIPLDGGLSSGVILASGDDFYSTPRLRPDGTQLCWLSWSHPRMPWDGVTLWVADVHPDGSLGSPTAVAGGDHESVYQPGWLPDGTMCFASDRDGWWRLYRVAGTTLRALVRNPPEAAEFGRPQWVFGTSTWASIDRDRMVVSYSRAGRWHLAIVHVHTGLLTALDAELIPHDWLAATARHVLLVAGDYTQPDAVIRVDLDRGRSHVLRRASPVQVDAGYVSSPEALTFSTDDGDEAYAFYYPPQNRDFVGPHGERPPLLVLSHGGPTTAARPTFDLQVQYWTSRGFAIVDVNYRGSSGYGRAYRQRLNGWWGIVDVADVVNAARWLVTQGKADVRRLAIRGGSAGGFTTLAALTFYPGVFAAGASYYGVSDLEGLIRDTHKFESRYLDTLIGPYPAMRHRYRERSPIHAVGRLSSALILFQGLDDKVVPPNQSEMMAEAVRARGLPVEYHAFAGEQHGFRRAETLVKALEAELAFYLRVL